MKIFISYSWGIEEWIETLMNELKEKIKQEELDIEFIWDKTHLKFGQDMNYFMENSIREADKVLIFCSSDYTEKANSRERGVGVETLISTPHVYNQAEQTKFIPVILWGNEVPDYLKSRFGIFIKTKEINEETLNIFVSAFKNFLCDTIVETVPKKELDIISFFKDNPIEKKEDFIFNFKEESAEIKKIEIDKEKVKKDVFRGIVNKQTIIYLNSLLEQDLLCKFILKNNQNGNIENIAKTISKLEKGTQIKILTNIYCSFAAATGYGGWENYDYFGIFAYNIYNFTSFDEVKKIARRILEECVRYRSYHIGYLLEEIKENEYL